jgi:hypothetical protein
VIAAGYVGFAILFWTIAVSAQKSPAPTSAPADLIEFPVVMQQNVSAGKTPAGTHVQAKLLIATLVNKVVVPRGALLTGEVMESVARTDTVPSRLSIRMDSALWKNGTTPLKVYLTAWYYPMKAEIEDRDPYSATSGIHGEVGVTFGGGGGQYPYPQSPNSQGQFPPDASRSDRNPYPDSVPTAPASIISEHRALMKDVSSTKNEDGSLAITSDRRNLKLDKTTTYVLASNDLGSAKK